MFVAGVLVDSSDGGEPVIVCELDTIVKTERCVLW